jgi:hypothetical protein
MVLLKYFLALPRVYSSNCDYTKKPYYQIRNFKLQRDKVINYNVERDRNLAHKKTCKICFISKQLTPQFRGIDVH